MISDGRGLLLTEGTIWKKIVRFALPIFWGNLLQQCYNVTDALVVGNFIGDDALAAVGSSGSTVFLLVGFFGGVFSGAGVVISRYFGARDKENVEKAVHTSVAFGLIAGVVMTVLGVIFTPNILKLMGTPEEVLPSSISYLKIYFFGVTAVILYNTANGIFQAVGDSRRPLFYLFISSITNIILDLLFVVVFKWGITSVAIATVMAQAISTFLGFYRLCKIKDEYRVVIKKIRLDKIMFKKILRIGIPSGVQNSIIGFANMIVQSNINAFGKAAMAGCGAYFRLEGFAFIPITSFALAITTFVSQNLGAKQYERAKKGAFFTIATSVIMAEIIGIILFFTAPIFVAAFNDDPDVINFGVLQARTESLFYCSLAFSHCVGGVLRGAGKSLIPMAVMMSCWCLVRITYITIIVSFIPDIRCVFFGYPITWTLSAIIFFIYYSRADWMNLYHKKSEN